MNKVVLLGRVVRDLEVRYSQGENPLCICRYTLAVPRKYHREGEQDADFINCIAFGKNAEFAEKYLAAGKRYCIGGHLQSGSYTNKEGKTVYYTEVVVEDQYFADSSDNGNSVNSGNSNNSGNRNGNHQAAPSDQNQGNGYQRSGENRTNGGNRQQDPQQNSGDAFMNIPDGIDEELPFN